MPRGLLVLLTAALLAAASSACASDPHEVGQPATRTISPVTPSAAAPPTGQPPATTAPVPSRSPSGPGRTSSVVGTGIAGQTVMKTCPVERADPPCPPTPVQSRLVVL